MKRHWLERQNGFAGAVHRFDLFLKSAGGAGRAELAEGVYQDWYDVGVCRCNVTNVADKAAAAHAQTNGPDTDNIIGRSDVVAGSIAQGRVVEAGSVLERVSTDGRVVEVGCNAIGYANFYSRSHDAVIRVYDAAGNVIETHEYVGEVKRAVKFSTNRHLSAAAPPFGSLCYAIPAFKHCNCQRDALFLSKAGFIQILSSGKSGTPPCKSGQLEKDLGLEASSLRHAARLIIFEIMRSFFLGSKEQATNLAALHWWASARSLRTLAISV